MRDRGNVEPSPNHPAMARPTSGMLPRVFVYPPLDPPLPCTNARRDKDVFETKLPSFLMSSRMHTTDPANATIFYHPACLTDLYFHLRNKPNGSTLLRDVEARVLAQIDALGYREAPHVIKYAPKGHEFFACSSPRASV